MSVLLGSNVMSWQQVLWMFFLYFGVPALLLIGAVVGVVLAIKTSGKK